MDYHQGTRADHSPHSCTTITSITASELMSSSVQGNTNKHFMPFHEIINGHVNINARRKQPQRECCEETICFLWFKAVGRSFLFFFYDVMISLRTLEMAAECTHLNTTVTRCSEINVSIKKASVPQASDKMYYSTNTNMNNKIRQIKKKIQTNVFQTHTDQASNNKIKIYK